MVILLVFSYWYYLNVATGWELEHIVWTKTPLFVIGMYWGYLSQGKKYVGLKWYMFSIFLIVLFKLLKSVDTFFVNMYNDTIPLLGIPLVCFFFNYTTKKRVKMINNAFNWLGKYSLELYILHMLIKMFLFYYTFEVMGVNNNMMSRSIIVGCVLLSSLCFCNYVHKGVGIVINKIK